MIVEGLENTNVPSAQKLAFELAQKWVNTNHLGYQKHEGMFEKVKKARINRLALNMVTSFSWSSKTMQGHLRFK